jgi:hypothetical protein
LLPDKIRNQGVIPDLAGVRGNFHRAPVSGSPEVNEEASDVAWFTPAELDGLNIHPTQWRQLRDWLSGTYPHFD